jgi:GcrA cell cycle regulator
VGTAWQCSWTDAQVALLKELWLAGFTGGEIGRRLGISRSAAMGKLRREGMLRQDRPKPAQNLLKTGQPGSNPPNKWFPAPPSPPPPPPDPPIGKFGLLDLRHGHCRWPGPQDRPPWTFCGRPRAGESSYCSEHHAMAHNRGSQRDYDRMAEQALAGKLFASRAGVME